MMTDDERAAAERNAILNSEAANLAHAEGRHGPGAVLADRKAWAALGCVECRKSLPGVFR
jgi:hypothetical protein